MALLSRARRTIRRRIRRSACHTAGTGGKLVHCARLVLCSPTVNLRVLYECVVQETCTTGVDFCLHYHRQILYYHRGGAPSLW